MEKELSGTIQENEITKKVQNKPKKVTLSNKKKRMTAGEREELLIENFVGLQHAMTNLSIKFGNLSDNISQLLQIFEESARNYAQGGKADNTDMLNKINSLLEQNKTIAKGLVLMEGKLRGGPQVQSPFSQTPRAMPQKIPQQPQDIPIKPKPLPRT